MKYHVEFTRNSEGGNAFQQGRAQALEIIAASEAEAKTKAKAELARRSPLAAKLFKINRVRKV